MFFPFDSFAEFCATCKLALQAVLDYRLRGGFAVRF
jgi:hypothetical protein